MRKYRSDRPHVAYLQRREWRWVKASNVCNACGCTTADIDALIHTRGYRHSIERKVVDGTIYYRYIGNFSSGKRRVIEYVKEMYPQWVTPTQVTKASNVERAANILWQYSDLMPIEVTTEYDHQQKVRKYRYVPDDDRSLLSHNPPRNRKHDIMQRRYQAKQRVLDVIHRHPNEWITARDISDELGIPSGSSINTALTHVVRSNSGTIERAIGERFSVHSWIYKYRYVPEGVAAKEVEA